MKTLISILLLSLATSLGAANYYVATTGNDGAAGSSGAPWLTIQHAVTQAVAGDTVHVAAGTYNEFVDMLASGSAGNPITFTGARGGAGEWLTVVDPSTALTNGWVAAPEIGAGVWKHTALPFMAHELEIGGKRLGYVWSIADMQDSIDSSYLSSGMTTGADLLAAAANKIVTLNSGLTIPFWDGIEALWCSTNTTVWLRLRDGSDPNGLAISIGRNTGNLYNETISYPAVSITRSYITWRNFLVRGAVGGVVLDGATAHHAIIESNYFGGGIFRVALYSGAHDNTIVGNTLSTDFYGWTNCGAWSGEDTNYLYRVRAQHYRLSKYLMGNSSTMDAGFNLADAGANNVIAANSILNGIGIGLNMRGEPGIPISNLVIASNSIVGQPTDGIVLGPCCINTHISDNLFSDSNGHIRVNNLGEAGETNRLTYIYRNRFYLPSSVGDHLFFHWIDPAAQAHFPTIWLYNNSFCGGGYGLDYGSIATNVNFRVVNNIFSGGVSYILSQSVLAAASRLGALDYNLLARSHPASPNPVWFGPSNIVQLATVWPTNSIPDFLLSSGSAAIDSALDTTVPFTLHGGSYAALPQTSVAKVGPAWDMGVFEFGDGITPPPPPPPPTNGLSAIIIRVSRGP